MNILDPFYIDSTQWALNIQWVLNFWRTLKNVLKKNWEHVEACQGNHV